METNIIQKEYDKTKEEIKSLETKLKNIEKDANKKGLFFKNGKIIGDSKILAAFWDGSYYSHFDGYASDAIYVNFKGSQKLKKRKHRSI